MKTFAKDPEDVLDYSVDWTAWLAEATAGGDPDQITGSSWTVPAGLVQGSGINGLPAPSFSDVSSTVWLGSGVLGEFYRVTNHITTEGGRQADCTFIVQMRQR